MANLFVYGTLRNDTVVKALTGKIFSRNKAVPAGYRRFEERSGFPYILKVRGGRVTGFVLRDLDDAALQRIDAYEAEGTIYTRVAMRVKTGGTMLDAETFVGNLDNIRRHFGDQIDETITTRVEKYLERQLGEHLPVGRPVRGYDDVAFQARKEFHECEIQHLMNLYFTNTYVSPNRIDENLSIRNTPTLRAVRASPALRPFAPHYLDLASRFMVFNRLADMIHNEHRVGLFAKDPFCLYSLTNLMTLMLLNKYPAELEYLLSEHCPAGRFEALEYTDYARGGAAAARTLFRQYATEIEFAVKGIPLYREEGRVPLGVEMEFSNIGRHATGLCRPADPVFDNFKYFTEFDLLRRCWRLGGHIDDHAVSTQAAKHEGGFLEFALGKNNLLQYTSKPVSADINVLAGLVREVTAFVPVRPHSLHINIENVLGETDWNRSNDPDLIKCLLLMAGDFHRTDDGRVIERRVGGREIVDPWGNIMIIVENRQFPNNPELREEVKGTIEFPFPRLEAGRSFTPLIMALKGFFLGYKPRPYSSKLHIVDHAHIREESVHLMEWALDVTPLTAATVNTFIKWVEKGLFTGLHDMSLKHRKQFLRKEMYLIEKEVKSRNDWIRAALKAAEEA
ncbi:MAG: gamma-glutamylcyclotransferase family protein [Planctomycetota bacterium]